MLWTAIVLALLLLVGAGILLSRRARSRRIYNEHSITPQALDTLIKSGQPYELFDLRLPLDVLANAKIIPSAKRVSPGEIQANPELLPRDHDTIVYCTCPSDETGIRVAMKARAVGYTRVCFLRGGLEAWQAAGYPVRAYDDSFELTPIV